MSGGGSLPQDTSKRSFTHLHLFFEEQQQWMQQAADVDLVSSDGICIAAHAPILMQWSSVLGGCIAATMPSKAAGSAQTLLRIPVDVTAQALTDLLRILYSGISWALLDELLVASKERLSEVLRAAHKLDVAQLVDRIQSLLYQQVTVASTQAGTEQSHIEHAKQWVGLCTDMHLDNTADWCNYVLKQQQTASEETEKADNAVAAPVAVPVAPPAPPSRLAKIRKFLQKI